MVAIGAQETAERRWCIVGLPAHCRLWPALDAVSPDAKGVGRAAVPGRKASARLFDLRGGAFRHIAGNKVGGLRFAYPPGACCVE
jgi:hypothetical protein